MAINFNDASCISQTSDDIFGIIDVPPAKLDFTDSDNWIVWVDNENGASITHTAIDQCVAIPRADGERCESMITYNDAIMFIELKNRDGGRWAGKARNQLINTIRIYIRENGAIAFRRRYGHIANRERPFFKAGGKIFYQKFEDETGFILRVSDVIKIE